ncbi:hypothetical protein RDABS01_023061 [Bienertia sinuspersici]
MAFTMGVINMSAQYIHSVVKPSSGLREFFYTFVYAFNEPKNREVLWKDMTNLNSRIKEPWLIMGDINCVMSNEERIGSNNWHGRGTYMYCITRKLKQVKAELKELNKIGFCSAEAEATRAYEALIDAEQAVYDRPRDEKLAKTEKEAH